MSIFRYALKKSLKWATRSSKHKVQSYDRFQGVFHVKTGRHDLNYKGGNIQILSCLSGIVRVTSDKPSVFHAHILWWFIHSLT